MPSRRKYSHIIWDWNGTLLDDGHLCVTIINEIIKLRDMKPISLEQYRHDMEFPVVNFYRKMGFDLEKDSYEELSIAFISAYEEQRLSCDLHNGASDLLKALGHEGHTQSILSAYKHTTLEEIIRHHGLFEYFKTLQGAEDILGNGKIENGRKHLQHLGNDVEEVVLIGDTVHDYEVANALGIDCILVSHGHQSPEKLQTCGVPVVASFEELLLRRHELIDAED